MSQDAFKNHVTATSFNLTLSKAMVETLCYLDQSKTGICKFMTYWSLKDRGLIEPAGEIIDGSSGYAIVRLTDTGRLVIPLLKAAGLYRELFSGPPPEDIPPVKVTLKKREAV